VRKSGSSKTSDQISSANASKSVNKVNTRKVWTLALVLGGRCGYALNGGALAVSLSSAPLMQSNLSPEEKAIWSHIRTGLRLTKLTPGQYLNFGVKVLTSDVNNSTSETKILDTTRW